MRNFEILRTLEDGRMFFPAILTNEEIMGLVRNVSAPTQRTFGYAVTILGPRPQTDDPEWMYTKFLINEAKTCPLRGKSIEEKDKHLTRVMDEYAKNLWMYFKSLMQNDLSADKINGASIAS